MNIYTTIRNKGAQASRMVGMLTIVLASHCPLLTAPAQAQQLHEYTAEQPLIIVSDWEFPPYEFRNDKGEPDGYNIDLLTLIFRRLNIPYRFVMKEWYQATEAFEKREADLIHALSFNYKQRPYVMTRNMAHFYRVRSVRLRGTKPLTHISQLGQGDTIIVKNNDYVPLQILTNDANPAFTLEYHSPREALIGVRNGKYKYFLWGERPINWKIKEFGLDSLLVSDETDIPPGELRMIGYDKELIDQIDDEYARLEQSGEVATIRDKWFHPEREHNDSSPVALFVIIGAVIMIFIGFILSRLIRTRVRNATRKSADLNNMMTQALSMGEYYVMEHDLESNSLVNVYGSLLPHPMTREEFFERIYPEDLERISKGLKKLIENRSQVELRMRWNAGALGNPDWRYLHGHTIVESEDGKPRYVVSSTKDVTREIMEERATSEMGEKYIKMFKTNLVAMSFYGADGTLIDLNDRMRELCRFDEEGERFFRQVNLHEVAIFKDDFDPTSTEGFHACQRMHYPDIDVDTFIEFRIMPIINDEGSIRYYTVTARDISDERIMYLEQRRHDLEMRKVSDEASNYETQLHYLLENSNMYVWRSDLKNRMIHFSRSLRNMEHTMTLDEYINSMDDNEQEGSASAMGDAELMSKPFNVVHHFKSTPLSHKPAWFAISGMPIHDKQGNSVGLFGIIRNITDLMDAQQRLKEETARAEDSGRLKSAFLANMTHEIRTPLNAIVGFSDLLPVIDVPEERMEFIRIIRNNCDMLLRLINDILEASSMGQALAIEPEEVDFSLVFDDICQTLAQRVQEPGVEFIKDNPYPTFRTVLDKGRVQQVLTNFTTNAVKYTHEGHIKVGYHKETRNDKDGLYFYCEDTGAGIPKEKQPKVFERFVKLNDFVQGTGLGLSICQSIADRCNGEIGVTSEGEGHGSTFWMWIPCEELSD